MKTAKFIKSMDNFKGEAALYHLSEPIEYTDGYDAKRNQIIKHTSYVIVSAVSVMYSGPETFIFPSYKDGEIINLTELEGSITGWWSHEGALRGAGYEIVE